MSDMTARHGLPLIQPGQAQKELTHNEALAALDLIAQPAVIATGTNTPPLAPTAGQCWLVGSDPTGAWIGQANALAGWTNGGWRFAAPVPGMTVWTGGSAGFARWDGSEWRAGILTGSTLWIGGQQVVGSQGAAIADPAGGTMVDSEARATVALMLAALRQHGLIAP